MICNACNTKMNQYNGCGGGFHASDQYQDYTILSCGNPQCPILTSTGDQAMAMEYYEARFISFDEIDLTPKLILEDEC